MATQATILEILANSTLFAILDDTAREAIAKELRPIAFNSGQVVFSRGERGRDLYIVLEGRVRLSVLTIDGRELSFAHAEPGDIFGEIAMLDGRARTADATAVGKTSALALSHAALERLISNSPALAMGIVTFLCSRLREADLQLEGVALHRIEVRLARYFASLAQQCSSLDTDNDGEIEFELCMSQGELALLLGASRPKVNAAMKMLEEQEIVRRNGSCFSCDLEELRAFAELDRD